MYADEAIESYRTYLLSEGLAHNTVVQHMTGAARLDKACSRVARKRGKRTPLRVDEIDGSVIAAFFDQVTGGQGNRNNMTSSLRRMLGYFELEEWVKPNTVTRLLKSRKVSRYERKPKHYVDAKDFPRLLDAQTRHPSDRMAMALLLYTLARRSEVAGIRVRDIDFETWTLRIYREKTDRHTDVGICWELRDELEKYLAWYEGELGLHPLSPEYYVIPRLTPVRYRDQGRYAADGGHVMEPTQQPRHMERIVKRGLDALGVTTTETGKQVNHLGEGCHTIRRSGARAMLKYLSPKMGSADALVTVSTMLDHKDTKQTLVYIGMDQQREELNEWLRGNSMYGGV